MKRDDPNASGNHRKNMMQSVEDSLKRLGTDYIDLYWVHAWDFTTPLEEVMRGLDDLVRQGKVLYVGISDTPAWIVSQANTIADFRGWSRFVGLQLRYSLIDRAAERDLLPMAKSLGLGVTPWSILGAGVLTGKYNLDAPPEEGRAKDGSALTDRNLASLKRVLPSAMNLDVRHPKSLFAGSCNSPQQSSHSLAREPLGNSRTTWELDFPRFAEQSEFGSFLKQERPNEIGKKIRSRVQA